MPFPYAMAQVIADIRRWTVDANGAIPTADLTALFNDRYFDWWAKYVERPESVAMTVGTSQPTTGTALASGVWGLGAGDDFVRYTVSPSTSIAKLHHLQAFGQVQNPSAPPDFVRATGGHIIPISNFEKVLLRKKMSPADRASVTFPDELGVRINSRAASSIVLDVCPPNNLPLITLPVTEPTPYDNVCLELVCTLNPVLMTTTGTDFPDLNESETITLARLTAYDAATLLERGPSYIANILSPIETYVLKDFELDQALRDARKATYAARA